MFSWLPAQWLMQCSSRLHGMAALLMVVVRFCSVALLDVRSMVFICLLCAFYYKCFACLPVRYGLLSLGGGTVSRFVRGRAFGLLPFLM